MTDFSLIAFIQSHQSTFWLCVGMLLIIAEMIGAGGYLLWTGVAGLIVGALIKLLPLSFYSQCALFVALSILSCMIYSLISKKADKKEVLNNANHRFIGQRITLDVALQDGRGHIRLADSRWPVICDSDLPAGSVVEIVDIQGITLVVKPTTT